MILVPDLDKKKNSLGFSTYEAPPNSPLSRLQIKLMKGCLENIVCYMPPYVKKKKRKKRPVSKKNLHLYRRPLRL